MAANQRDLVERLLRESILTLCRETISYKHCLEVDGIVCITAENEPQQIVIKVHEQIQRKTDGYETSVMKYENSSKSFTGGKMCFDGSPSLPPPPQPLPLSLTQSSSFSSKDCVDTNGNSSRSNRSDHQIGINGHVGLHEADDLTQEPENCSMRPNLSLSISDGSKHTTSILNSSYETLEEHSFHRSLDTTPNSLSSKVSLPSNSDFSSLLAPSTLSAVKPYTSIQCKRCEIVFPDASAFEKHNLTEHSVFTCNICYRTFTARNNLKRHIRLHTGYKPYTCNICSNSFTRKDDLKFHLLKHNYDKPYRCNQCNKGYMDRSCLSNHMRNEHNCKLMHVCPQCGEGFNNTHVFMEHKKTHPELKEFQCTLCNFTGINSLMYQKHMLTHGHKKKNYMCEPCNMQFDDPFTYTIHLKRHRIESAFCSYVCCFCENKLPTYKQFIRHEHSHAQSKTHACRLCHKQFRYPSNLREHMMVHESNVETDLSKQYWCTECNQGFGSEDFLRCHIFEVHEVNMKKENSDTKAEFSDSHIDDIESSDDDPYTGGLAEQERLQSSDKAASHEENDVDMNDNPEFEERVSALENEDDSTLVINEGDERETRATSKKTFTPPISNGDINIKQEYPDDFEDSTGSSITSDVLAMNESVRNSNAKDLSPSSPLSETKMTRKGTGTKPACFERVVTPEIPFRKSVPFTCKECGEVYQDFDSFESHSTVVHRRYVCEYCGKIFTSKPNRERHVRYHTGERPYKCDLCSQSFFRGDDLKYHRTTRHSDIRPFKCKQCGLYFSWPKDLNRHLKSHTQNDL